MEQPRRRRLIAIAGLALAALGGAGWALLDYRVAGPAAPVTPSSPHQPVLVEVLNGSGRRGLARTATRVLRRAGFDVVYFGTAGDSVQVTQALARRGDSTAAVRVARVLGTTQARIALDTLLRVDVTVLLGQDYRPPPGIRP